MMTVYLWAITIGGAVFLFRTRSSTASKLLTDYKDDVDYAQYGSFGVTDTARVGVEAIFDVISDTGKYIALAVVMACVSLVLYVWAIRRPEAWKSYTLFVCGIGITWGANELRTETSIEALKTLQEFLVDDKYSIVVTTLLIIAHVYMITAAFQLLIGRDHRFFWWEAREELRSVVAYVIRSSKAGPDSESLFDLSCWFSKHQLEDLEARCVESCVWDTENRSLETILREEFSKWNKTDLNREA